MVKEMDMLMNDSVVIKTEPDEQNMELDADDYDHNFHNIFDEAMSKIQHQQHGNGQMNNLNEKIRIIPDAKLFAQSLQPSSDGKPYACDTCDKAFKRKSHLNRHKLLHTGEKPFACDLCNEKFTRSENRARHIAQIHHQNCK